MTSTDAADLQRDFDALQEWGASGSWNSTRRSVRYVTRKHKPVEASYTINGQTLQFVDTVK